MLTLPDAVVLVLVPFVALFTNPTWLPPFRNDQRASSSWIPTSVDAKLRNDPYANRMRYQ